MTAERLGALLYGQRRAIVMVAVAAAFTGILSWLVMPRQEDPALIARFGSILIIYPGGDADSIEELIAVPLEDELRGIAEIAVIEVAIRPNAVVFTLELAGTVREVDPVWDEIESALRTAEREFPRGVEEPITDWDSIAVETVIIAVGGSGDRSVLWDAARDLQERLYPIPGVKTVRITPDVDRELVVMIDEGVSNALGIGRNQLAGQLSPRLTNVPGGQLRVGTLQTVVDPRSGIATIEELRATEIALPGGASVPLASIASLSLGPAAPPDATARLNNRDIVTVGIVPQPAIDVVAFGEAVTATVDRFATEYPELTIDPVTFQPRRVATRLNDLLGSLLQGVAIVAAIVVLAMGVRLGLTVAVMVPVVALGGLALYASSGAILHQVSIAALVMSLGLLVDNAIVMAERIQWRLDAGEDRMHAAGAAVKELLVPLASATGTTLASYLPLLLSQGETAEFTGAIPRVMMVTLTLSYLFAVIVIPTIAIITLRPARGGGHGGGAAIRFAALQRFSVQRPRLIIAATGVVVVGTLALLPMVQRQFFPSSDRNQFVIDIELPRGTHIGETSRVVSQLEHELLTRAEVVQVAAFAGRTVPRFYYNVLTITNAPYRGQILVTTTDRAVVEPMVAWLRERSLIVTPQANVIVRKLEQGPPVNAPVELRIAGTDRQAVAEETQRIVKVLQELPEAVDVRSTLSVRPLTLSLRIDDARANALGITRAQVAQAVRARVRGIPAGEITYGDTRIPVLVRSPAGEGSSLAGFDDLRIASPVVGSLIPLAAVASVQPEFLPVEITRRNGIRTASVLAELAPGAAYNEVLNQLDQRLAPAPPGIERVIGGAAEESAAANRAIADASYPGAVVLLTILLLQFRSFRKVGIVMTTVPLAAVGVIPGLVIFGQPYGFTSLLGVIALIGIVVNNAIILIDLMDAKRNDGTALEDAITEAVAERMRPIVLTAGTTIAGMLPLLFSSSSLWPPFASAIISGLAASTVLTILVVPALYRLMFARPKPNRRGSAPRTLVFALIMTGGLCVPATRASAEAPLGLGEIAERAAANAIARAAIRDVAAARSRLAEARRGGLLPTVSLQSELLRRNEALTVASPFGGTIEERPIWQGKTTAVLAQPLINPAAQIGAPAQRRAALRVAGADAAEARDEQAFTALLRALEIVDIVGAEAAAVESRDALRAQHERLTRLAAGGRALQSDADRIEIALLRVERDLRSLRLGREVAEADLERLVESAVRVEVAPLPEVALVVASAAALVEQRSEELGEPLRQRRNDLVALRGSIDQTRAAADAVRLQHLPSVEAQVRGVNVANGALQQNYWVEGALILRWAPLAAGVRAAGLERLTQVRSAIEQRYAAALDAIEVELQRQAAQFEIALDHYRVQERALELALRLEAETARLFEAGRSTSSDYIAARAEVRRERTARDRAITELLRTLFTWRRALGLAIVPEELGGVR